MHLHAAEFFESMRDNPKHVAMIVHLILLGDYGKKPQAAARRALKLSKKAKLTKLTQLAGAHEFGVSARVEVKDWDRLTKAQQAKLDRAILGELKHHHRIDGARKAVGGARKGRARKSH